MTCVLDLQIRYPGNSTRWMFYTLRECLGSKHTTTTIQRSAIPDSAKRARHTAAVHNTNQNLHPAASQGAARHNGSKRPQQQESRQ